MIAKVFIKILVGNVFMMIETNNYAFAKPVFLSIASSLMGKLTIAARIPSAIAMIQTDIV